MVESATILVQVCYFNRSGFCLVDILMPENATLLDAVIQSKICEQFHEINLNTFKFGIFGKLKLLSTELQNHNRIEIYRPLIADPMEARRRRAKKNLR